MDIALPDLPPLWSAPAPIGHNGGPALAPRRPGRPSISTPELRDCILDLLGEGVPLRVICRTAGMPGRQTVYRWRQDDAGFDRQFRLMQEFGYMGLVEQVVEEADCNLDRHGVAWARYVFNLRRQQLSRINPRFFGDRALKC